MTRNKRKKRPLSTEPELEQDFIRAARPIAVVFLQDGLPRRDSQVLKMIYSAFGINAI